MKKIIMLALILSVSACASWEAFFTASNTEAVCRMYVDSKFQKASGKTEEELPWRENKEYATEDKLMKHKVYSAECAADDLTQANVMELK